MPNRILREGILTSERVNALTWEAEVFYRRLMSVVDDYGRFSAHPSLLRAALFPLKLDTVRDANMERLLALVEQARLVRVYEVAGKRYLEMLDFKQQVRAKESKCPQPPSDAQHLRSNCAADAQHVQADAHLVVVEDVVVVGGEVEGVVGKKKRTPAAPAPPPDVPEQVWNDWLALRKAKRAPVTQTVIDGARAQAEKARMSLADFLAIWCRRGSQGLEASWLKPEEIRRSSGRAASEPAWRTEQRNRVLKAVPGIAARPESATTIDVEVRHVPPATLG